MFLRGNPWLILIKYLQFKLIKGIKLKKHVFLTGFMGSGKSTIGKRLATRLKVKFIDTDDRIEARHKLEIKEIFKKEGESQFRKYEESMLDEIIKTESPAIISLGGGTLLSDSNQKKVVMSGFLVYIESAPTEIWNRIKHSTRRPLLRKDGDVSGAHCSIDERKGTGLQSGTSGS